MMNFIEAIKLAMEGKKIRCHWEAKGTYISVENNKLIYNCFREEKKIQTPITHFEENELTERVWELYEENMELMNFVDCAKAAYKKIDKHGESVKFKRNFWDNNYALLFKHGYLINSNGEQIWLNLSDEDVLAEDWVIIEE